MEEVNISTPHYGRLERAEMRLTKSSNTRLKPSRKLKF